MQHAPFLSLGLGPRVIRHESHNDIGETFLRDEPRTVERMEPGRSDLWRIPDVMQPGRRNKDLLLITTEERG
jgi:hypothetical protein